MMDVPGSISNDPEVLDKYAVPMAAQASVPRQVVDKNEVSNIYWDTDDNIAQLISRYGVTDVNTGFQLASEVGRVRTDAARSLATVENILDFNFYSVRLRPNTWDQQKNFEYVPSRGGGGGLRMWGGGGRGRGYERLRPDTLENISSHVTSASTTLHGTAPSAQSQTLRSHESLLDATPR
jgi:hypothetical protein